MTFRINVVILSQLFMPDWVGFSRSCSTSICVCTNFPVLPAVGAPVYDSQI